MMTADPHLRLVEDRYHDALRRLGLRLVLIVGASAIAQLVTERVLG